MKRVQSQVVLPLRNTKVFKYFLSVSLVPKWLIIKNDEEKYKSINIGVQLKYINN